MPISEARAKLGYAYEKLIVAVGCLATSADPLRQRLRDAIMAAHTLEAGDFSPELRDRWSTLMERLTKEKPVGHEGTFQATISKMSVEEQIAASRKLFDLFLGVSREYLDRHK